MPGAFADDYKQRCARVKARRAKLIAKGIDPRSTKFSRLMARRG
jgi:hypothetical protein